MSPFDAVFFVNPIIQNILIGIETNGLIFLLIYALVLLERMNSFLTPLIFFFILPFITIHHGQAQTFPQGLFEIKNYSAQDYQWHPLNHRIVQGNNGLIYVCNSYGVLEYDGNQWRQIVLPNSLSPTAILQFSEDQIFIGSANEFGFIQTEGDGVSFYKSIEKSLTINGGAPINIKQLYKYERSILIITTNQVLQWINDEFTVLYENEKGIEHSFLIDDLLNIYHANELIQVSFDPHIKIERKEADRVRYMKQTDLGTLSLLDDGSLYLNGRQVAELPRQTEVNSICVLKSGHYALSTFNSGLFLLDEHFNILQVLNTSNGLSSDKINEVIEDREQNLWLALDNGISHVILNTPFTSYNMESGILGMGFGSAVQGGQLFLGTSQGVFTQEKEDTFEILTGTSGQVYELKAIQNDLFIAHEKGLFLYESDNLSQIIAGVTVWTVIKIPSHKELLLIGTERGMLLIKKKRHTWTLFKAFDEFVESSRIIVLDSQGFLWMCHGNKGLYRFKLDMINYRLEFLDFYSQSKGNLPFYISNISPSRAGVLFSGENGILAYNAESDSFNSVEPLNQFLDEDIYVDKLTEDASGNLWIIQENVIKKLDLQDNGIFVLLEENILKELNGKLVGSYEHLHVYDGKHVIIGTNDGFSHFNVNHNIGYKLDAKSKSYQTLLRSVEVIGYDSSMLLDFSRPAMLESRQNSLSIKFAAGFFQSFEEVQYSHYIKELNSAELVHWSDWDELNQVVYNNLAPGQYEFHVRVKGDKHLTSSPASYAFSIASPWYAKKYSFFFYSVFILIVSMAIYKLRVGVIQKEKSKALGIKEDQLNKSRKELSQQKMEAETEKIKLINERLKEKVVLKNKELGSVALEISQKNEFLSNLKKSLTQVEVKNVTEKSKLDRAIRNINQNMRSDNNWDRFAIYFDESHQDFIQKIKNKHPEITKSSINLCAFIKLNLSNKEIAALMNISVSGVEKRKYRLRKQLGLDSVLNIGDHLSAL